MLFSDVMLENIDLEYNVLGCMLFGKEHCFQGVSRLKDADFTDALTRAVFQAMSELSTKGEISDFVTVLTKLSELGLSDNDTREKLVGICGCSSSGVYIGQYIDKMLEMRYRRQVVEFSKKANKAAKEEANLGVLQETLSEIPVLGKDERDLETGQILQNAVDRIAERFSDNQPIPGNCTGFGTLDKTVGGMKNGELITLTAEPNVGKSLLAFQICINNAKNGLNSVYFNYEMNEQQIGDRALAIALPFEIDKIKYPKENFDYHDKSKLAENDVQEKLNKYLHIFTNTGRTLAGIRARCIELEVTNRKPNLIVVDYLQIMDGAGKNEYEKLNSLSKGLKDIAKEFNCPLIAITSLNNQGNTRGSGQINYDADQMWHLKREHQSQDKVQRAFTELIINKNRDGGKGIVQLAFLEKYLSFRDVLEKREQ